MSFITRHRLPLSIAVLLIAVGYAFRVHELILLIFPILRVVQPIEDFPYTCERVQHPLLEGCEDLWLDHDDRKLYAACASISVRTGWSPGGNMFNTSARDQADHIAVIDIDHPGSDGLYGLRQLSIGKEYQGDLDLLGFDAHRIGDRLRFWLINHRPPVDPDTGGPLDAFKVGANSTIEIFDLVSGSETLEHVKTIVSDAIISPNGLAVDEDGTGFAVTNDHTSKIGHSRVLELFTGGGSVSYCQSETGQCHIARKEGCNFPNGITNIGQGQFVVSQTGKGTLIGYSMQEGQMIETHEIELGLPLDNLAVDEERNIFIAGIPNARHLGQAMNAPYDFSSPSTAFSVPGRTFQEGQQGESKIVKVLEDRDGTQLPTATVVVHDARTERLFFAGVLSPFIGICKKESHASR